MHRSVSATSAAAVVVHDGDDLALGAPDQRDVLKPVRSRSEPRPKVSVPELSAAQAQYGAATTDRLLDVRQFQQISDQLMGNAALVCAGERVPGER